ncbi:unnamed protein product [Lampetra fluviatilis]
MTKFHGKMLFIKCSLTSFTLLLSLGIAVSAAVKACSDGMYLASSSGFCCMRCPPGESFVSDCTSNGNFPFCSHCEDGYYMDIPTQEQQCKKCSSCGANEEILSPCNSTHDTTCDCKEGFQRSSSSSTCEATGLSKAAIAVIVIISVVFAGILLVGVYIAWKRKNNSQPPGRYTYKAAGRDSHIDGPMPNADNALQRYYEYLKRRTSYIIDYNSNPGQSTLIKDRFVQPLLLDYHYQDSAKDHAVITAVKNQERILEDLKNTGFYCKQLFDPCKNSSELPHLIVLVGVPGIGKTTLTKMMIQELLSVENFFHVNFKIIVYIQLRELNSYPRIISLREILQRQHSDLGSMADSMFHEPRDVLLVLDGLDEFRNPLDIANACSGLDDKGSIEAIVCGLVIGKLLPEASVLLTTRPIAIDQLRGVKVDRFVEISGFTRAEIKEYLCKLYPEDSLGSEIASSLEKYENVFNLCYIPAFCYIAGTALKPFISRDKQFDSESATLTMTDLFSKFVYVIITHHRGKITNPRKTVAELAKLALWGIEKHIQLFSYRDLQDANVNVSSLKGTFINELFKNEEFNSVKMYFFSHLTIQEYFASLTMYLHRNPSLKLIKQQSIPQHTASEVIKKIEISRDGRYEMVKRFICGLASPKPWKILKDCIGPPSKESQKHTLNWIAEGVKEFEEENNKVVNLLHCLFELQDPQTAQNIAEATGKINLSNTRLSPMDCATISYAVRSRSNPLETLALNNCGLRQREVKELVPAMKMCKELSLDRNEFADLGMRHLAESLAKGGRHLEELRLGENAIEDDGARRLARALLDERKAGRQIQLEKLHMQGCGMTEKSASALRDIIVACSRLKVLRLSDNRIADTSVDMMAKAMGNENEHLGELAIRNCSLTDEVVPALRKIVTSSPRLKLLGVSLNSFTDETASEVDSLGELRPGLQVIL